MAEGQFRIQRLERRHNRGAFSCGSQPLDDYLKQHARQNVQSGVAATFVLEDTQANLIAGYYTLSSYLVRWDDLPLDLAKHLPRYPVPAVLMGRLAVDQRYRGKGFGGVLLVDGLKRALARSHDVGAVAVVVDAKDDGARSFYIHYGFRELLDQPYKLFITMRTIAMLP